MTHTEETVFAEALEKRDPRERAAFLDQVCGGDPALRAGVEALLSAYDEGEFLECPALTLAETVDAAAATERPGTVIGRFKLLEQIGEGAFGVVFMAEQQQPMRRKVALKVLKPGMDTKQVSARFEAERQALALMDHPNIAKVLDAGQTSSGRPYFVMDLVKGLPITEFCDQAKLPIRERLELFLSVCQAVQHAHQKGIIHRDIKPSNVLVTLHDGTPLAKVIDFGIAKALGQELTDKTLYTGFAQLIGTPLYMSPEQAAFSNVDVDTRSDIYSLGVLLYELLTGTTPFDKGRLHQAGYDEMRRIIREEEPPKPSTRISTLGQAGTTISTQRQSDPKRLGQFFRAELDWIVMKCLEKDRDRRYETANGLGRDIQRYLSDEPVQACPPSVWYRWRKFARRYRGALAMAAVVLVAVVLAAAGVAGGIGWAVRDRAARDAALDEAVSRDLDEAEALLQDTKGADAASALERAAKLLNAAGRTDLPSRVLELRRDLTMAQRLEDIWCQPRIDDSLTGMDQDAEYTRAFRDYQIDVFSLPVAEAAERIRARTIRVELVRALDCWATIPWREPNRKVRYWKQLLAVAKAADSDPWCNRLRDAVEQGDCKALAALAASTDIDHLPPGTLHLLGRTLARCAGDGSTREKALALLLQAHRRYPADLWINDALGECCMDLRRYDDSVRFCTAALAVRPHNPHLIFRIGNGLFWKGAYEEAIAEFSKAIALKPDYENAFLGRARAYLSHGQPNNALADYSKAIDLNPRSAYAWCQLGNAYAHLRQWDDAVAAYSKSIESNPRAATWWQRGWARAHLGQWQKAIADYSKVIDMYPVRQDVRQKRAYAYSVVGEWDKAAADLAPQDINAEPPTSDIWLQLACLRLLQSDVPGYRQLCQQLIESAAQSEQGTTGSTAYMVSRTCTMLPEGGADLAQALLWAEDAVTNYPKAAWSLHALALAHYRAGHLDQMVRYCRESLDADPKWDGGMLNRLLQAMAHVRQDQGDKAHECLRPVAQWRQEIANGTYKGDAPCPPEKHLSDWLEFQVLWREAETLFDRADLSPSKRE
jgi:tetratricopeptide (TPR) repeat protein